jgi:23S rRNA (uridine2552-2'-O)-methyltransferase
MKSSSRHWLAEHCKDKFVLQAQREGYQARSAYKLLEMMQKFNFIKKNSRVLDLGAAPGSWIQAMLPITQNIDAVDLLSINLNLPIRFFCGDIFSEEASLFLNGRSYDVILSDMAPNCGGNKQDDHAAIMSLAYKVLQLCRDHLLRNGNVCIKIFDGNLINAFLGDMRSMFKAVKRYKPAASRASSSEFYLLGLGMRCER